MLLYFHLKKKIKDRGMGMNTELRVKLEKKKSEAGEITEKTIRISVQNTTLAVWGDAEEQNPCLLLIVRFFDFCFLPSRVLPLMKLRVIP